MENTPSEISSLYNLNKISGEDAKSNLYTDVFIYVDKNFKQYIEKMNHNLGNYKANQSKIIDTQLLFVSFKFFYI
jgi:hypothetical protein